MIDPVTAFKVWGAVKKYWKPVAILAALVGLSTWGLIGWAGKRHAELVAEHAKQGRALDRQRFAEAQARATAIAQEAARNREAAYAKVQKEKDRALSLARADYDARLRQWMRDNRADQGAGTNLPGASQPTGATAAATDPTFLVSGADLERCTAAYAVAEGWREWWLSIEQTQGAE